ncbi:hypothetical protein M413DRAFT_448777 [Hebeloma cylindrosporum]|uniref:Uncharacterized protein n=1 Tax=Hebeloma cylindrosporum TaxID=76867 RepID=A0A0C3BK03_HEBCY|nr:hypothetical protein M413DRAFT_448777 [Hebeloma cylindrosporum h7]
MHSAVQKRKWYEERRGGKTGGIDEVYESGAGRKIITALSELRKHRVSSDSSYSTPCPTYKSGLGAGLAR